MNALKCLFLCLFLVGSVPALSQQQMTCQKIGSGLPTDTAVIQNKDGSMDIGVPEGWSMLVNDGGKWQSTTIAAIKCRCESEAGGCNPFYLPDGTAGCAMTTCHTCSMGRAKAFFPYRIEHAGIAFASREDVTTLPSFSGKMLESPAVIAEINKFKRAFGIPLGVWGDQAVMVRIYGHIAAIEVPSGAKLQPTGSKAGDMAMAMAVSKAIVVPTIAAISCKCESAGSCPHESRFGVHWCDATACQACTMSGV